MTHEFTFQYPAVLLLPVALFALGYLVVRVLRTDLRQYSRNNKHHEEKQ